MGQSHGVRMEEGGGRPCLLTPSEAYPDEQVWGMRGLKETIWSLTGKIKLGTFLRLLPQAGLAMRQPQGDKFITEASATAILGGGGGAGAAQATCSSACSAAFSASAHPRSRRSPVPKSRGKSQARAVLFSTGLPLEPPGPKGAQAFFSIHPPFPEPPRNQEA